MKDVCIAKYINALIKYFLNINAVFAKAINTTLSPCDGWEMSGDLR